MTLLEAIALSLSWVLKQTQNTLFTFRRNFIVCVNCGDKSWTKVVADSIFALKAAKFNSNQMKIANKTEKKENWLQYMLHIQRWFRRVFLLLIARFCSSHGDRFLDVLSRSLSTKCYLSNIWQMPFLLAWREPGLYSPQSATFEFADRIKYKICSIVSFKNKEADLWVGGVRRAGDGPTKRRNPFYLWIVRACIWIVFDWTNPAPTINDIKSKSMVSTKFGW